MKSGFRHILPLLLSLLLCLPAAAQDISRKACENALISAVQQYEDGDAQKAASMFEAILKKDPKDDAAHYYLGLCHVTMNNIDEAELHFSKAVELDSTNYWYRQRLALVYAATQRNAQAIEQYEALLRDFPKKSELYYTLVDLYAQEEKIDEAIVVLDKIDTLSGGVSEGTVIQRFRLLCQQGKDPEAYALLEKANEEFESPQVKAMLGDYQLSLFNDKAALALYDEALELAPGYAPAVLGRAETFRLTKQYEQFFATMEELIVDPDVPEEGKCQYLQAFIQRLDYKLVKSYGAQVDHLVELCAETYPESVEAAKTDCGLKYSMARLEDLSNAAHKYRERFPEEEMFIELAMYADYNLDRHESVLELSKIRYEMALKSGDKTKIIETFSALGDAYHMVGNQKQAFKIYKAVIKANPDYAPALNNYAYYLSEMKKSLGKAAKMSAKSIELEPDNATYLDTYGWILHLQKKDEEALAIFKKVMIYGGKDSAVVLRHYADVLEANGKKDLAEMYRKQADAKEKQK